MSLSGLSPCQKFPVGDWCLQRMGNLFPSIRNRQTCWLHLRKKTKESSLFLSRPLFWHLKTVPFCGTAGVLQDVLLVHHVLQLSSGFLSMRILSAVTWLLASIAYVLGTVIDVFLELLLGAEPRMFRTWVCMKVSKTFHAHGFQQHPVRVVYRTPLKRCVPGPSK